MTIRRSLAAALAAGLLLTACAAEEEPDVDVDIEQPADPTETPADEQPDEQPDATPAPGDTESPAAAPQPGSEDPNAQDPGSQDPADSSQPVVVAVTLDGQRAMLTSACNGVDGAVLATTDGDATISLVREEGLVLRYQADGQMAETPDVQADDFGATTVYRATIASDQVGPVDVEMEVGDTTQLPDC